MSFQSFFKSVGLSAGAVLTLFAGSAAAQQPRATPSLVIEGPRDMRVAERNNLYCAGYVQTAPVNTDNRIVGAVEEQEQFYYSQNNFVYINAGAAKGVKPGDMFTVIRPRGTVNTKLSRKDDLGFYVQEVGALEVVRVKNDVSVARVKTSCNGLMLGDLIQPMQERMSPMFRQRPPLDLFSEPSGKAAGRVFMARDNQEMLGRDQIVYIDLGAEDNVQVGDYLTVFRPLGKGNLFVSDEDESIEARNSDYGSDKYKGGHFSNQAPRKSGDRARGRVVTTEKAKEDRPASLRKVVGEMIILNVRERTATAVIIRNAQEIHTGDWVEVQ
ncbi:MAG: FlgT C-terminal domain-containing protein [Acidobacteriota bacterium]